MSTREDPARKMKTTEKSLRVLEAVQQLNSATVTEISTYLDMNKSSAYTHLVTLTDNGYLVKTDGRYQLGMRLLGLGIAARRRDEAYQQARVVTEELADETGDRANFIIEEHGVGIFVWKAGETLGIPTGPQIGGRVPLHATASGKAILAFEDDSKRNDILDTLQFDQFTENTVSDRETLLDRLATIRNQGFAINEQEDVEGANAIAAPVCHPESEVLGALSVVGPAHRLSRGTLEDDLADVVLGYANELEHSLAGEPSDTGYTYDEV